MREVLLDGYYRMNFGDDLFIKIIVEKYKNVDFYSDVYLGYYSGFLKKYSNFHIPFSTKILNPVFNFLLRRISDEKLFNLVCKYIWPVYRRINHSFNKKFNFEVFITGSTFMERSYKEVPEFINPIDINEYTVRDKSYCIEQSNCKKLLIGANVGPVYTDDFLNDVKNMLQKYNDVCFRDIASYNLYSFMSNVRFASDVVFNLSIEKYKTSNKKEILINLIDLQREEFSKIDFNTAYSKIAQILDDYVKSGYMINLVSFCKFEGDEFALDEIKKRCKNKKMFNSIYYNGKNIDEILQTFSQSEYIIANRFHAMILAMLFEKPFVPICYSDKMTNYLNDVNFEGKRIDIFDVENIDFDLVNYNLKNKNIVDITQQINSAKHQFDAFEKLIKEK